MKVRDLIKRLEEDGWEQIRMRGSHRQFRHGPTVPELTQLTHHNCTLAASIR